MLIWIQVPPQLWRLQLDDDHSPLLLRHSFTSVAKDGAGFAALASVFGGANQSLVMRAETSKFLASFQSQKLNELAGNIHIWDRDTAYHLHLIRPTVTLGHISSLAWNMASNSVVFATGCLDGAVRLWSFTTPKQDEEPASPPPSLPSPTPTHQRSPGSASSNFRRHGSSFGLGPRSESPTVEDIDPLDLLGLNNSPRITRRATTLS